LILSAAHKHPAIFTNSIEQPDIKRVMKKQNTKQG
jgi:hypothetical protein